MLANIHFSGPARWRFSSFSEVNRSILEVSIRRALKGPRRPSWNWLVEVGTQVLKRQLNTAYKMRDVDESRRYLDSIVLSLPARSEVNVTVAAKEKIAGKWFLPKAAPGPVTALYFHGGGYSFYPRMYDNFIAQIALATKTRMFALKYRLSPEFQFPSQLQDAVDAYRWLLQNGTEPDELIVGGDSAGGNLTLALLLVARDSGFPLPAMAFALSPPTDFECTQFSNEDCDWIDRRMLFRWAQWFCDSSELRNPLVSPLRADLRGLPPIYIQAGRAEILYDSIQAFSDNAQRQGADVVLETWEDMNHDFQMFGPHARQSAEALHRLGKAVADRVRTRRQAKSISS